MPRLAPLIAPVLAPLLLAPLAGLPGAASAFISPFVPIATVHAQDAKSPPEATVVTPMQDLGFVGFGTDPAVEFTIRNTGAQPLTLELARPPQSLRVVHVDGTIAPGKSGVVRLQVATFVADEAPEWKVFVTTNDPLHQSLELTVRAKVRAFLTVTPPTSRFNFVQFGKEGGTQHTISAQDDGALDVLGVDSPFPFITATVTELKGADRDAELPGRQWRVALTIRGNAPVGPIGDYVIVRTSHPKQPRAFIPVSGFVRPLFAVTPTTVALNDVRASNVGTAPLTTLVVKNFGETPLALTKATSDLAGLEAKVVEVQAGHSWRVELHMSAKAGAPGPFEGTLRIATTSTHVPELVVPIKGTRLHDAP